MQSVLDLTSFALEGVGSWQLPSVAKTAWTDFANSYVVFRLRPYLHPGNIIYVDGNRGLDRAYFLARIILFFVEQKDM